MSGGVDSSVVAGLLAREGKYDLEGVFMRNWDTSDESGSEKEGGCAWEKDWVDVQRVCGKLGIRARMVCFLSAYFISPYFIGVLGRSVKGVLDTRVRTFA